MNYDKTLKKTDDSVYVRKSGLGRSFISLSSIALQKQARILDIMLSLLSYLSLVAPALALQGRSVYRFHTEPKSL